MKRVASTLLVDDNSGDLYLAKHFLERSGRFERVCEVGDGQSALELVSREAPSLILLDLRMPRLDGFGFLDAYAKLDTPCAPVVILSSSQLTQDRERALALGAVEYLVKPFTAAHALALAERFGKEA